MKKQITQEQALEELQKGYSKAEKILNNGSKIDQLLEKLKRKLKKIPKLGEQLSYIPVFIQLVKCYIKKQYTTIPTGSIIAIVSALTYVLSPFDLIPDWIPGAGYLDDALIISTCFKLVEKDIKEFIKWREENKYVIEVIEVK